MTTEPSDGVIWNPQSESIEETNVKQFMDKTGAKSYADLVKKSTDDISWWWSKCGETIGLEWFTPYSKTLDTSRGVERTEWFLGGSINLTHNALDKQVKSSGNSSAFIWEGEDGSIRRYSYSQLARETNMFCNYLKGIGVRKGDVVSSCLPMLPETIVAMFAAIKIGAVFSPIFCGYGPTAIANRLVNAQPKLLIVCDGYLRKGTKLALKPSIDEALQIAKLNTPTINVERLGIELPMSKGRDVSYNVIKSESSSCEPEQTSPDDPAILLYTSGTTGKPKGAVISHAGALLQPGKELYFNLDVRPDDVFMWITDIGWMMGPWQVIGAQLLGATHVMFEGVPDYPKPDRIWRMIEDQKITHLGYSATTIRMLKKYGSENIKEHNLSTLRILGNTGEVIDPDTWTWAMRSIGEWRCPMINLSGGTEIFGSFLLPSPIVPLKPSTLWGPGLGMDIDVFNDSGKSVREQIGYLVCKKPSPSMSRGFWNNFESYIETYWRKFPGVWYHGDWAVIDSDGFWFLNGRVDDVIKVAGRRIGPAEIESILNSHPAISESAAIGLQDEVKGEKLYCFVLLKPDAKKDETTRSSANALIGHTLGRTLVPDRIVFVDDLPRTRSGKIIRKLIRAVMLSEDSTSDTTALENPESLESIRSALAEEK